jgi:hypothetical protein
VTLCSNNGALTLYDLPLITADLCYDTSNNNRGLTLTIIETVTFCNNNRSAFRTLHSNNGDMARPLIIIGDAFVTLHSNNNGAYFVLTL